MLPEFDKIEFKTIEVPKVRRSGWGTLKIATAILAIGGAAWAWQAGYRPPVMLAGTKAPLELVEIDRGDVDIYVVENGSIESAMNTTVRCQVKALLGLIGGTQGTTAGKGQTAGGTGSGQGSGGAGGAGGQGGSGGMGGSGTGADASASKSKTSKKKAGASGSSSKSGSGSSSKSGSSGSSGSSGLSGSSGSSGSGSGSGGTTGSSGGSEASGGTGATTSAKPVLRSFTYMVTPYVPLRPTTTKAADTTKKQTNTGQQGGGGGGRGGRGGGGRGGRGGGMMLDEEKTGSTRIVSILPDGTPVKAGQVVCQLDASSYQDEEKAQLIRFLQAKSYVEQAKAIQEVNEITLREYRDGIYPQDLQLIRHYIQTCQVERDRSENNLKWSREMLKLDFRTPSQVKGDGLALQQATIALEEAKGMLVRLTKFTGPKIILSLEANVAAIRADRLMQDASFSLETQRLEEIRRNIALCTVRAPQEGIIVYANQTNNWGMVEAQIDQGVTLRQDQPIFHLPDPQHMRVKARINESKVSMIQTGQPVIIHVDAFPDRPLKGTVAEITPISVPMRGSDVRIYYANVDIKEGFNELRPGLSAEILVEIETRHKVTRVPIESIRWVGDRSFVALYDRARGEAGLDAWRWHEIEIGLSDPDHAEVLKGLEPGDRVVARPGALPAPARESFGKPESQVTERSGTGEGRARRAS